MSQVKWDAVQAVVHWQDHNWTDMIYVGPGRFLVLDSGEQYTPEEHCNDNFKSETRLVKENAPFPQEPRWIEIAIILQYWGLTAQEKILTNVKHKEEGICDGSEINAPISKEQ